MAVADRIIEFLRKKDFVFVRDLGHGACGKTVLLKDQVIEEHFVCKKFSPIHDSLKEDLFDNFVREIKLLFLLNHSNVVRVFNYYLYPEQLTGYILMEVVDGVDIEEYIKSHPENINSIFSQVIDGFSHIEKNEILHRDIRIGNILVSNEGVAKIIDFGFGKKVVAQGFDKSITLNWWCELPEEFSADIYDYSTEVYFIGKLFEKLILENGIEQFSYKNILSQMCAKQVAHRARSFSTIKQTILADQISDIPFSYEEKAIYRNFANDLTGSISKIEHSAKYFDDAAELGRKLESAYRAVMLEQYLPKNTVVANCFINGAYYFNNNYNFEVENLQGFLHLIRSCSREKKDIVISNLFNRLDAVTRYDKNVHFDDDDIPF